MEQEEEEGDHGDDEEDDNGEQRSSKPFRKSPIPHVRDVQNLKRYAVELKIPQHEDFLESFTVVDEHAVEVEEVEDDLKRENTFYASALRAVKKSRAILDDKKVVHLRPLDYMVGGGSFGSLSFFFCCV